MNSPLTIKPRTEDNHFASLRWCMFASAVGLTVSHFATWAAVWVMLVGVAPLMYYHLGYLRPKASEGISQTAIDSVYYFGFLVTIAALALSAVTVAKNGKTANLDEVAYQFGLGLLATGYAVFARMHLSSINAGSHELSAEAILDRYAQRSTELVSNVELASEQFATMAANLSNRTERIVEEAHKTLRDSLTDLTKLFDEQMRSTLASSQEAVREVRALVHDTSFANEREEMQKSMRASVEVTGSLSMAMTTLARQLIENSNHTERLGVKTAAVTNQMEQLSTEIASLGGVEGKVAEAGTALVSTTQALLLGMESIRSHVDDLEDITDAVKSSAPAFRSLRTLSQKLGEQMGALYESTESLSASTSRIGQVATEYQKLAQSVEGIHDAAPSTLTRMEALGAQIDSLVEQLKRLAESSTSVDKPVVELQGLSEQVAKALGTVGQAAKDVQTNAFEASQAIQRQTHTQLQAVERIQQAAGNLQYTNTIHGQSADLLKQLTQQVQDFSANLAEASAAVRNTVGEALKDLQSDVRKTSELSHLFGERMNEAAQFLLDEAQRRRAA